MSNVLDQYMKDKFIEVILPSNKDIKFKIKRVSMRSLLLEFKKTMLLTNNSIKLDNKNTVDMKSITKEQVEAGIAINNRIIVDSVVEPKITLEREDGCLFIDDLLDEDYNFLVNKIKGFGEQGATDLKPFRTEPDADNTGQDGEKVQQVAN